MRCLFRGGKTETHATGFICDKDNIYLLVENVPAEVCVQRGEKTYTPEVADELIRLSKARREAQRTIPVPVFDYAGSAPG